MVYGLFSEGVLPGLDVLCNARTVSREHTVDKKNLKEPSREEHSKETKLQVCMCA